MEYGQAKRKAARNFARRSRGAAELPSNEQVEDEVRTHLALFCAETQPLELRAMREAALRCMQGLAEFRPHLAGAVWRGTATRQSSVQIDLYCDDPKAAEIALINLGVAYDTMPGDTAGEVQYLRLTQDAAQLAEPVTIYLAVRDLDDLRGALKPDAQGRSWRGDLAALRRLLGNAAST